MHMPIDAEMQKIFVESRGFEAASEITITSVVKTPLFRVPVMLLVAGGCSVEVTTRATV